MEKTMARAIYKKMELGKEYTTRELFKLLGEWEYFAYRPMDARKSWGGMGVNKVIAAEMWKVVNAGFATTEAREVQLANVRGLRFGRKPTSYSTYTIRYWKRTK